MDGGHPASGCDLPTGLLGGSFAWQAAAFHDYDSWALYVTRSGIAEIEAELSFHVDSCDVVALLCFATSMAGGESAIVSGVAVHDEMMRARPDLCATLYGPIPMDRRGEVPAGGKGWYEMPLFHWQRNSFTDFAQVRLYVEAVRRFPDAPPLAPIVSEALDLFYELCADPRFCLMIPFRPGDIQYIHNHVVFHARTGYIDHPPPAAKRHLMRLWLSAADCRELPPALLAKRPVIQRGKLRGEAVIAPECEWVVPLEPGTPAY